MSKLAYLKRTSVLISSLILMSQFVMSTTAQSSPKIRADLNKKFKKYMCETNNPSSITHAWQRGVFDGQIEGRRYKQFGGNKIDDAVLEKKAISLAKRMHHNGAAFGTCSDGSGWTLSVPASRSVAIKKNSIVLPWKELKRSCKYFSINFVSSGGGKSLRIKSKKSVRTKPLGNGTLSVTCKPKAPRWQGPVLWYLVPVGKGPASIPPHLKALTSGQPLPQKFAKWINLLRQDAGLNPLNTNTQDLNIAASMLGIGRSIIHNRKMIKDMKKKLKIKKLRFLGENRVEGNSGATMAWLLWNSPQHRNLLLNSKATHIGMDFQKQNKSIFSVLVIAKGKRLKLVKKKPTGKPGKG